MRALKIMLAYNGVESILRGVANLVVPTLFYLEPSAPKYALDAVRVLAITYLALGVIQLGAWRMKDPQAVRLVAIASALFAAGVALQAASQGTASTDTFHQAGVALGPVILNNVAINVLWVVLYTGLLVREGRMADPDAIPWAGRWYAWEGQGS
jgi:hypothetical protein